MTAQNRRSVDAFCVASGCIAGAMFVRRSGWADSLPHSSYSPAAVAARPIDEPMDPEYGTGPPFGGVKCERCGAVRPKIEMAARLAFDGKPDRYWCHGFLDDEPTCYMRASWEGKVYA